VSKRILIFIPTTRGISPPTVQSVLGLFPVLSEAGIVGMFATASLAFIEELRNIILTVFYDTTDASHLLFVDDDVGFPPSLVMDLITADVPLCGAMYAQRSLPLTWAGTFLKGDTERRGPFLKVEGIGMGVALIRRDCVDAMLQKFLELSDERVENHLAKEILGPKGLKRIIRAFDPLDRSDVGIARDDIAFCMRHSDCGGDVWAHITHTVRHIGMYDYGKCFADEMLGEQLSAVMGLRSAA
jgi:hypothetical protein